MAIMSSQWCCLVLLVHQSHPTILWILSSTNTWILVFFDDICVYSKNEEEHEENLWMVLQENQFFTKLSKCFFYQIRIQYLGHVISKGDLVDPKKVELIINWPNAKTMIDIKSFIGLASYWKMFIEGFSKISHSITSLQINNIKFMCFQKC